MCRDMKLKALDMAVHAGAFGSHIGGGFSIMEILTSLYDVANIKPEDESRDRIIVSKAHCVLALDTVLWQKGFVTDEDLDTFDQNGTDYYGHAHRNVAKGIEFSGGSLGLGASYAIGVAKACKMKNMTNRIFAILGDGECDEGIVWEAMMSASSFNLHNLTMIVDRNKYQLDGPTDDVMNQFSLEDKFKAFGFDVETVDGHNLIALHDVFSKQNAGKPKAIIADTIKAHGISFLENNKLSHQCALSPKKYEKAKAEILAAYDNK